MSMIDKQRAIALKELGLTNKQVAQELGCSEDWCKRNLKGIKKKDIAPEDFEYLKEKGRSKSCVTTGEIYKKLIDTPEAQDQKKAKKLALRRTKDKLREDKEVIIRQAWIHPERARFSYDNMIMYINDLSDRMDEYVRMHLIECGFTREEITDSLYNSTLYFMVKNSIFSTVSNGYQQGVFNAVDSSVDRIEERIEQLENIALPPMHYNIQEKDLPY